VVFVQGCPWRCVYCHNPHLQRRGATAHIGWANLRGGSAPAGIELEIQAVGLLPGALPDGGVIRLDCLPILGAQRHIRIAYYS
jgi:pyruvate formate lyase activating enzyme